MLSSTVMSFHSRMFWKVRATPRDVTWCGFMPRVSTPPILMDPDVGW